MCVCVCYCAVQEEEAHMPDYLIGTDQKIPEWLIKLTFLGKVETATRSGVKSRFGSMGFSMSDAILGLWFSLNKVNIRGSRDSLPAVRSDLHHLQVV